MEALRHLHEDGEDDDDDDGDAKGSAVRDAVVVVADLGPLSVDHHVAERRVLDQNELVLDAEAVLHGVGRLDRLGAARQHLERLAVGVGDVAAVANERGPAPRAVEGDAPLVLGNLHEGGVLGSVRRVRGGHVGGDGAEDAAHDALDGLDDPARPEAAAHAEAGVAEVGKEAAERPREDIHEAEHGGGDAGELRGDALVVVEESGGHVVHRELDAEAEAVREREEPGVDVGDAGDEDHLGVGLLLGARLLELGVVAVGQVARGEDGGRADHVEDERHDVAEAPRSVDFVVGEGHHDEEDVRHRQVGDAAAEVAPAAGGGVDGPDDALGEHLRAPDLAGDEGGEREADERAAGDEGIGVLRGREDDEAGQRRKEEDAHGLACSKLVAERAGEETHRDGRADGGGARRGELVRREAQPALRLVLLDPR
mmetsp:Transcript_16661/g.50389  ORF Transcript_16661/g.50389 Transcript_16661/m.50389 type:complete len:426 (-) Transcript_16661:319-1596(-)